MQDYDYEDEGMENKFHEIVKNQGKEENKDESLHYEDNEGEHNTNDGDHDSDEEYQIEGEESKKEPKENNDSKKFNLRQQLQHLKAETMQKAAENQRLINEVEELRNLSSQTSKAAVTNYEIVADYDLKDAIRRFKEAEESGDIEEKASAAMHLNNAQRNMEALDVWKNESKSKQESYAKEQNYAQQNNSRQQYSPVDVGKQWIAENPWFVKGNPEYDEEIASNIEAFGEELDRDYPSEIGTPQYIQAINQRVNYLVQQRMQNPRRNAENNRGMNMQKSKGSALPVRGMNSHSSSSRSKGMPTLSKEQHSMLMQFKNNGVDQKYRKAYIDAIRKQQQS